MTLAAVKNDVVVIRKRLFAKKQLAALHRRACGFRRRWVGLSRPPTLARCSYTSGTQIPLIQITNRPTTIPNFVYSRALNVCVPAAQWPHRRRHPTTRPQAPKHPTRRQLLRLLLHKLVGSTLPRMCGFGVPALIALLLGQVRRRRPIVRGIHVHDDARRRHGDYHRWQRQLSMSSRRAQPERLAKRGLLLVVNGAPIDAAANVHGGLSGARKPPSSLNQNALVTTRNQVPSI
eukprot:scaffold133331_cov62-Phaeocystis_antarctica.AAC.3